MKKDLFGQVNSVEELAQKILVQARDLVKKLETISSERGLFLSPERLQDAFISFSQVLMLAYLEAYQDVEEKEPLEQKLFLTMAKLIFEELISRSPTENEFDYFLTYYRSHLELLRKELSRASEGVPSFSCEHPDKCLSFYLEFFLDKGKIGH